MRTDIKITMLKCDMSLKGTTSNEDFNSLSQIQGMLNTWITQDKLVKVDSQPISGTLVLFKIILKKD